MSTVLWPALGWLAILPCAIANGALREAVLVPRLGVRMAQPLSGGLLMLAIAAVTWLMVGRIGALRSPAWIAIGAAWLAATLVFEFALGIAAGTSWPEMLAPYRCVDNNLWPLVLVWVAIAPLVLARWRGLSA